MLTLKTLLSPYKLILHEGGRVTLEVTVQNRSSEPKLVSVTVTTPYDLALNTGGFMRRQEQRLGVMKPGEERTVVFNIFARPTTSPGTYELIVTGTEHEDSYEYVLNETEKHVKLTVIK